MDISGRDISPLVFQLSVLKEAGELTLDKPMLAVIQEIDGKKSVGMIAKNLGMESDKVSEIFARLLTHKIITLVSESTPMVKEDFFVYLTDQLSLATGPMAEVLIDEAMATMGYTVKDFPKHRLQELIDLLAPRVFREEKRAVFKQNLYKKILSKEV